MAFTEIPDRPAFQSTEVSAQVDRPPTSRLAIAALVIGVISLLAVLSTILLPLAILACALGAVAVWKLSRDEQMGGIWLAQIGLILATASVVWSVTATTGRIEYMYAHAADNAKIFLDTLAAGKKYEALEMRKFENERQLTGTNLEVYYSQREEPEEIEDIQAFLEDRLIKQVMQSGIDSDWQFSRGISVHRDGKVTQVIVEMVNKAASAGGLKTVKVHLRRQTGLMVGKERQAATALWSIDRLE